MYKESEYEFQEGFTWTSEVVDNTREVKLLDDHNILKIEDNKKLLENLISNNTPFIEYEYTYTWWMAIPHYHSNGDYTYVTYTYIPMTSEDFTTDPNHSNLTGRIREANYKYYGYTIVTDENGKSKAVRSQLLDNLLDVKSECPYFSLSDYTQIIYGEPYHVMTRNFRQ